MADNADRAGDNIDRWDEQCVKAARGGGTINDHNNLDIDHGLCKCGEKIPAAKRKALPGVRYCIRCSELNEMDTRNYR